MTTLPDRVLFAYLEGEVTASEAEEVERTVERNAADRERLEELRSLRARLGEVSPELEAADLVATVREALAGQGDAPPRRRSLAVPVGLGAGLVVLAAAVWLVFHLARAPAGPELASSTPGSETAGEFRPKTAGILSDQDRWVGLRVYRVRGDNEPERLGDRVSRNDGLLFSYVNGSEDKLGYLMVFAVDGRGEVHWCYPAWQDPERNPPSIPIRTDARTPIELPDLIHHDFAPGPLVIYGLFTAAPLHVRQVEAAIAALEWDPHKPPRLPFAGSGQHALTTQVEP